MPSFSKTEFEDCGKQRLCDVVLCVRVKLPVYESGEIYVPPVMLQNGIDRLRLAAGGLHDCFIGEKSAIPHASFPPFPHKAAVWTCGYGGQSRCGCACTACRFSPVKCGGRPLARLALLLSLTILDYSDIPSFSFHLSCQ